MTLLRWMHGLNRVDPGARRSLPALKAVLAVVLALAVVIANCHHLATIIITFLSSIFVSLSHLGARNRKLDQARHMFKASLIFITITLVTLIFSQIAYVNLVVLAVVTFITFYVSHYGMPYALVMKPAAVIYLLVTALSGPSALPWLGCILSVMVACLAAFIVHFAIYPRHAMRVAYNFNDNLMTDMAAFVRRYADILHQGESLTKVYAHLKQQFQTMENQVLEHLQYLEESHFIDGKHYQFWRDTTIKQYWQLRLIAMLTESIIQLDRQQLLTDQYLLVSRLISLLKALQAVLLQPSDPQQQSDFNQHIQYVNDVLFDPKRKVGDGFIHWSNIVFASQRLLTLVKDNQDQTEVSEEGAQ